MRTSYRPVRTLASFIPRLPPGSVRVHWPLLVAQFLLHSAHVRRINRLSYPRPQRRATPFPVMMVTPPQLVAAVLGQRKACWDSNFLIARCKASRTPSKMAAEGRKACWELTFFFYSTIYRLAYCQQSEVRSKRICLILKGPDDPGRLRKSPLILVILHPLYKKLLGVFFSDVDCDQKLNFPELWKSRRLLCKKK